MPNNAAPYLFFILLTFCPHEDATKETASEAYQVKLSRLLEVLLVFEPRLMFLLQLLKNLHYMTMKDIIISFDQPEVLAAEGEHASVVEFPFHFRNFLVQEQPFGHGGAIFHTNVYSILKFGATMDG